MTAEDTQPCDAPLDERVLILAQIGRDGELARGVLEHHGVLARCCEDPAALLAELQKGCGVVLLAEESL